MIKSINKILDMFKKGYKYEKRKELEGAEAVSAYGSFIAFTECVYTRSSGMKLLSKPELGKIKFDDTASMRVAILDKLRKLDDSDPKKRAVFTELFALADHTAREYELMGGAVENAMGAMTKNKIRALKMKERIEVVYIGFCRCLDEELEVFF